MILYSTYHSPAGLLYMAGDGDRLTGLWFAGQRRPQGAPVHAVSAFKTPAFQAAASWLDCYFTGRQPDFTLAICLNGTDFQRRVWTLLTSVPFGKAVTYGDMARRLFDGTERSPFACRAVGQAVSRNPIALIVPCHRVLGAGNRLTGYAGGLDKKRILLALEHIPYVE